MEAISLESVRDGAVQRIAEALEQCGESGGHIIVRLPGGKLAMIKEVPDNAEPAVLDEVSRALADEAFLESLERAVEQQRASGHGAAFPLGTRPGDEDLAVQSDELLLSLEAGISDLLAARGECFPSRARPE